MEVLESEGQLRKLNWFVFGGVELIDAVLEFWQVQRRFSEEGLGGELLGLFVLQFSEEEVFFDVWEDIMEVVR